MKSIHLVGAIGALATSAAAVQNAPACLAHGPLDATSARVFDLRTQTPNALVLVFRSQAAGPYVPSDPALPALGVAPGTVPFARTTDGTGRLRIVLPPALTAPAAGRSAFQALVRAADGRWEASNPVAVRRNAATPTSGWLAEASAPFPPESAQLGAHAVLAADLDRDGREELLLAHANGVALWLDHGAAGYVAADAAHWPHPALPVSCLAVADVDRDGDLDVFTGGTTDNWVVLPDRLWRNDGAASLAQDGAFPAGDGSAACAEFGDVDGDGDPDLLVARGSDGHAGPISPCELLRNSGATFTTDVAFTAMAWNQQPVPSTAARFGDVDDDGDLDVYVARSDLSGNHFGEGEPDVLLENDGTGHFTDVSAASFATHPSDNSLDARFVDVELDGDLDVVVANSVAGITPAASGDLWINQGGAQGGTPGRFVDDATSPLEDASFLTRVRLGVVPGDADADGDADLLVLVHDLPPASQHMLLLNQGGAQHGTLGRFERATWFDPGAFVASGAVFVDRDRDGAPELVLPAGGSLTGPPAGARRVAWIPAVLP